MIELTGLHKTYQDHVAVNNVNLTIPEGEIFGIVGKSGAGKSTLLRCINLLEKPDTGQVILDQNDLTTLSKQALRKARQKTAMIFQHFNLINTKTVFDNIALPMRIQRMDPDTIETKINELLPLVGLENKRNAYPTQLSGGQKQRVAIARALAISPKVLLCDEATSALDPETTESILALLKKINSTYGITIVLITHEMDVIKRICHRLAVMSDGEITETLDLAEAFSRKNSIAHQMLYSQLNPTVPPCLARTLCDTPNNKPVLRLYFEGKRTTVPFISQVSRDLHVDVNILVANIDRFHGVTCGVLLVEVSAKPDMLDEFIKRCEQAKLTVETLGYVTNHAP